MRLVQPSNAINPLNIFSFIYFDLSNHNQYYLSKCVQQNSKYAENSHFDLELNFPFIIQKFTRIKYSNTHHQILNEACAFNCFLIICFHICTVEILQLIISTHRPIFSNVLLFKMSLLKVSRIKNRFVMN